MLELGRVHLFRARFTFNPLVVRETGQATCMHNSSRPASVRGK